MNHPVHTPIPNCPILTDTALVIENARQLVSLMRKLKRDLKKCEICPAGDDCPVLKDFNSKVQAAISEVLEEYNQIPDRLAL